LEEHKVAGKNINYFLMDGSPSGRIKCTISNWTGVAYRIPRTELEKCKERDDLKQSGVYFLFGTDEDTGDNVVYIGQAGVRKNGEGILFRLQEHKRKTDKDYWTEAVIFTTSNNSFGPTEISWLENRFCALAGTAKRYIVKNSVEPNLGNPTEEKESELEEFAANAKIVMGVLGHKVFEPLVSSSVTSNDGAAAPALSGDVLELRRGNTLAKGQRTSDGFVLFKGANISLKTSKGCPNNSIKQRELHASKISEDRILQEDILLRSPHEAAGFVTGNSCNAREIWKTTEGKSLGEIEASEASET